MSRERAHEILTMWRDGIQHFTQVEINRALVATGDIAPRSLP